MACFRPR